MKRGRVPTFDEQNITDAEILVTHAERKVDELTIALKAAALQMNFARQNRDRLKRGREDYEARRPKS